MKLTWFGTAALLFSSGRSNIAFDPFLGIPIGCEHPDTFPVTGGDADAEAGVSALRAATDVFVTHGHFDHILQIPAIYKDTLAQIYATATPCDTLRRNGVQESALNCIRPGENVSCGAFTVSAFRGKHCRFDAALLTRTAAGRGTREHFGHVRRLMRIWRDCPENGETLFYELEAEGIRVQIMGSMGLDYSAVYPTEADVLILPYQGKSELVSYGLELVGRLRPRLVLLDHYDDSFPPLTSPIDTASFERALPEHFGAPCRALCRNETIQIGG